QAQGLAQRARLAEWLEVEPGWEVAVETVLGADLQAVLVDDLGGLDFAARGDADLNLLLAAAGSASAAPQSLLGKVRSPLDLSPWLGRVRTVETLEQGLAQRASLAEGESLVSRDGYWIGRHFLRVRATSGEKSGVLARAQELQSLQAEREALSERLASSEERLAELRAEQQQAEEQRARQLRELQAQSAQLADLKARLSAGQARAEQLALRRRQLEEEAAELELQREQELEQL